MKDDAFEVWWSSVEAEITAIQNLLSEELSDNPGELNSQLRKIERWHSRLISMKAWANSFLAQAERAALMQRSDGWTDLDRKADQKWKSATERRVAEIMEGTIDSIKNRLILGEALMKSQGSERVQGRTHS